MKTSTEKRIVISNNGWQLIGDFVLPTGEEVVPAVLLLNQAAGERTVYVQLARHLAERGMASLRLDLRGHGQSTNLDTFVPGNSERDPMIWDAEGDVATAVRFLSNRPRVDSLRIGVVGASYSGEESAEAGRLSGFAAAYTMLSPGSFSDESIDWIDISGVPWMFVVSEDDPFLTEITQGIFSRSRNAEVLVLPGLAHATNIFKTHPAVEERIAAWFERQLRDP